MGYYIALAGVVAFSMIFGWWLNDWWREFSQQEEEEVNGEDR